MLHVVCCHFNPAGYRRPREHFWRFRDALSEPLTVVEASFDGEFHCDPDIRIEADRDLHTMWQKERMLNLGLAALPASIENVAWIDADVIFMNPDWAAQAEEALDRWPVVQLFETVEMLGPDEGALSMHPGKVAMLRSQAESGFRQFGKTGFAWAARREALGLDHLMDGPVTSHSRTGGLFDLDIVGGGDSSMLSAWTGRRNDWLVRNMNTEFRASFKPWACAAWNRVRGRLGYIPGTIRHLFHGSHQNRRYITRTESLRSAQFSPGTDIALDENGLWRWSSDKPEMHAAVRKYFTSRMEDA